MKDASLPLQAAIVTALASAGYSAYVNPKDDETLPYVVIGGETAVSFPTKTTEGMECTATLVAWADDPLEAKQVADAALQAVTDRDAPLAVTGFGTAFAELDFRDSMIREDAPPNTYWGVPLRVRFRMVEV